MCEEFEKWAAEQRIDPENRRAYRTGWNARQPEIDALKDSLHRAINDARNFCQIGLNNWSEIQRLKAENERLRADAERYRFVRRDAYTCVIPHGNTIGGERIAWITRLYPGKESFDAAIGAAMKDFSTTQKEEECDS